MKKRLLALIIAIMTILAMIAGCNGNIGAEPGNSGMVTDEPVVSAQTDDTDPVNTADYSTTNEPDDTDGGDEDHNNEVSTDVSGAESNQKGMKDALSPDTPAGTDNSILNNALDAITGSVTASPAKTTDASPAASLTVEPPVLLSGEYFGSGPDSKFALSVVIPASAFEFQGSYRGSGEVELEVSYRDVGGAWIDWDEQRVNLLHIDQTDRALDFLYPAEHMIPRTEFRVRLTYRYMDDSGEHTASSAWSDSANSMPDAPEPDGSEVFVGQWHSMNMLAAGWDERYALHADGTYIYAASQINLSGSLIYMFGTWSVYEGALALFVERILSLEGAQIIHDENLGDYYEGGTPVVIVSEFAERSLCQIERGGIDPESGRATIKINGHTWYNFDEHDEYTSFFSEYEYYMS